MVFRDGSRLANAMPVHSWIVTGEESAAERVTIMPHMLIKLCYCTGLRFTDERDRLQPVQVGMLVRLILEGALRHCRWGSDAQVGWRIEPTDLCSDAKVSTLTVMYIIQLYFTWSISAWWWLWRKFWQLLLLVLHSSSCSTVQNKVPIDLVGFDRIL